MTPQARASLLARKWQEIGGNADDLVAASLLDRCLLASITGAGDVKDSEWTLAVQILRAGEASGVEGSPPCVGAT